MDLVILGKSEKPIYEQIYDQISSQILGGTLKADGCLPSIRSVARELNISIITVKRAYEMLEAADFIYTRAGKGCFVTPHPEAGLRDKKLQIAEERVRRDAQYYRELGLTYEEVIGLLKKYY